MTTLSQIKAACGLDADAMPMVSYFEPNVRDFIRLMVKFWKKNVITRKVINDNTITPLEHFIESAGCYARSYWMMQFCAVTKELGTFDDMALEGRFPRTYTVAKIKDAATVEHLTFIIQATRKMFTPMVDYGRTKIFLPKCPKLTPFLLGFYPDNRDTMTQVILSNRMMTGKIDMNNLIHGLPLRRNVLVHITRTFLPNYPTQAVLTTESLAIQGIMYSMTHGPLRAGNDQDAVNPDRVPWDIGYCPPELAPWDEPTTGIQNGMPNQEYPPLAGQFMDLHPWHIPDSLFEYAFNIVTPQARTWPPFSESQDDFRTMDFRNRFPDIIPVPANLQLFRGYVREPINPDNPNSRVSLYYTSHEIDPDLYRAERILPTVSLYRPYGEDANPPRFVLNFTQNNVPGLRGGFAGTWNIWDATDISLRLVKEDVRTFSRNLDANQFVANQVANYANDDFPNMIAKGADKPMNFGLKPQKSRRARRAERLARQKPKKATKPDEIDQKSNEMKEKLSATQVYDHPKPDKVKVDKDPKAKGTVQKKKDDKKKKQ